MRIEVDGVIDALQPEVPPRLDVRDLHGVADGLHVAGRRPRLRPEERRHAGAQQVADCNGGEKRFVSEGGFLNLDAWATEPS